MTLTKSQKIALCGLGVAVCALAGDRIVGGGAATAEAATVDVSVRPGAGPVAAALPATPPTPSAAPLSAIPPPAPAGQTLAARLRALAVPDGSADAPRDAFSWPAVVVPDAQRDVAVARAAAFKSAHTLKAVVGSGTHGHAMIDGRLMAVGQSLDGFVLVGVDTLRATFAAGGTSVVLTLPGVSVDGR